jgi:hypothetical protein
VNSTSNEYSLVSVNTINGSFSIISTLGNIQAAYGPTFDNNNHRLIFPCVDNTGNWILYSIDVITGNVISQASFANINELQYDNSSNKLYGLYYNTSLGKNYIVSINISTGSFSEITSLPDVTGVYPGNTTFDNSTHHFIFAGDSNGSAFLYSVNVTTGSVVYKAPILMTNRVDLDNLLQFRFDNSSGNLYALHWEGHTLKDTLGTTNPPGDTTSNEHHYFFKIYPNPFSSIAKVVFDKVYNSASVILYDALGRIVRIENRHSASEMNIERKNLAAATYFYLVVCDRIKMGTGKIIIE